MSKTTDTLNPRSENGSCHNIILATYPRTSPIEPRSMAMLKNQAFVRIPCQGWMEPGVAKKTRKKMTDLRLGC